MALADNHKVTTKLSKSFDSVELTEAIVLTRTRAPDLDSVKKLNCWASNIGDVSVVRKMPGLEVCSLSINKITSLRDFAHCYNLKELYVRTNKIERLGDIHYLKHLRKLRSLWLSENPCAGQSNYRMTVLRTLPNLRKLDNIAVTEEEVQQAETEGNLIPVPEDFSSSSLFTVEAFNRSKTSASPPNSARSVDSTKSMAGSVMESVGISVENSVGNNVNVSGSDCKWALPRRRRQQRKREEMARSSAGDDGGGSARSGEDSSGPGDGKGSNQVSCSSDSHAEEDNDGDCNGKRLDNDELDKETRTKADGDLEVREEDIPSSSTEDKVVIAHPTRSSTSSEENKSFEEHGMNGQCSDKGNEESSQHESKTDCEIEVVTESPLGTNPDFLPVSDCAGSVNVLRISDLENTDFSEPSPSSNNTLVHSGKAPCEEDKDNSSNNSNDINNSNCNSNVDDKSKDINLNEIADDKASATDQLTKVPISDEPSVSNPAKLNEHSLLDQIRLDDSLDVLDSAAEENSVHQQEVVTSIDLEHLEVEITHAPPPSVLPGGQQAEIKPRDSTAAALVGIINSSRPKPPLPSKPKTGQVNMEELNRMRAELGIRPMSNTRSSTPSTTADTSVAKNSNVLQAVLCLLKELDREGLDVVEAAVKTRIEELK